MPFVTLEWKKCSGCRKTHLLFEAIKILNDDSNKEVQDKKRTHDDEHDVVEVGVEAVLIFWLLFLLSTNNKHNNNDR